MPTFIYSCCVYSVWKATARKHSVISQQNIICLPEYMCGYASVGCIRTKLIKLDVRINGSCLADAECLGNTILFKRFQCFFVLFFVTWSFRNHTNMLIWRSSNTSYYEFWKQFCCLIYIKQNKTTNKTTKISHRLQQLFKRGAGSHPHTELD